MKWGFRHNIVNIDRCSISQVKTAPNRITTEHLHLCKYSGVSFLDLFSDLFSDLLPLIDDNL